MPIVWLWMFIAGIGVGPTFSVFTIVIQNAVPFRQLGVATSNLTFFRQIGGTIALAFVGTIFAHDVPGELRSADRRGRRSAAGRSRRSSRAAGAFDLNQLTGVGDLAGDARQAGACRPRRRRSSRTSSRASTGRSASRSPRRSGSAWSGRSSRSSRPSPSRRSRSARRTRRRCRPSPSTTRQAATAPAAKPATSAD